MQRALVAQVLVRAPLGTRVDDRLRRVRRGRSVQPVLARRSRRARLGARSSAVRLGNALVVGLDGRQLARRGARLAGSDHGEPHVARAARPTVLVERTCTWSTLPTSSTSVPGRACGPRRCPGRGRGRRRTAARASPTRCRRSGCATSKVRVSARDARRRGSQVTPTAPYPVTGSAALTTWLPPSAPILVRALSAPGAALRPGRRGQRVLVDVGLDRSRGHEGLPLRLAGVRREARHGVARPRRARVRGRLPDDVQADDGRGRREHGEHRSEGQQLLTGGDETGFARAHCWLLQ